MIEIREVKTAADMRAFVQLPKKVYQDNPHWAPPMWSDEKNAYKPGHNPILAHSDYSLVIALDNGEVVGRNLCYIDKEFNKYYKTELAFFGAFECLENYDAAKAMIDRCMAWAKERGMKGVRGPIHPVAEVWGFLAEAFDSHPIFLSPYNPEYYVKFVEKMGFEVVKRLLVYDGDARKGYEIPQRFVEFTDKLLKRKPNIKVRHANMRGLKREAEHIWRISNASYADNWGYVPVEYEVMVDMLNKVKPIVNKDSICFLEADGEVIGYAFGFLDLNLALKAINGNLFPFGFVKLLATLKKMEDYRLFGLAIMPEYQNMGLDVLLYVKLFEGLAPRGARLEANYVLEDNYSIRNALEKLGLQKTKSYLIYEKDV